MLTKDAMELREIEQADARRYKAHRRKMRATLRRVADSRGRVTTDLHHLTENAGLGWQEASFALGDMERRGEIEVVIFPPAHGQGLIRLRPKPWNPLGEPVYNYAGRLANAGGGQIGLNVAPVLRQKNLPA